MPSSLRLQGLDRECYNLLEKPVAYNPSIPLNGPDNAPVYDTPVNPPLRN